MAKSTSNQDTEELLELGRNNRGQRIATQQETTLEDIREHASLTRRDPLILEEHQPQDDDTQLEQAENATETNTYGQIRTIYGQVIRPPARFSDYHMH